MASAAKKQHRIKEPVRAHFNPDNGKFDAWIVKQVVELVEDPLAQWSVEEAQDHKSDAKVGDEILIPISTDGLGRIAAQSAKQVLYQRIREAERDKVYDEYAHRVGEVVNGTVRRFERGDIIVDLGRTEAVVPRQRAGPPRALQPGRPHPRRHRQRAQGAQGAAGGALAHRPAPADEALRDGGAGDLRRHGDHQERRARPRRARQGRRLLAASATSTRSAPASA